MMEALEALERLAAAAAAENGTSSSSRTGTTSTTSGGGTTSTRSSGGTSSVDGGGRPSRSLGRQSLINDVLHPIESSAIFGALQDVYAKVQQSSTPHIPSDRMSGPQVHRVRASSVPAMFPPKKSEGSSKLGVEIASNSSTFGQHQASSAFSIPKAPISMSTLPPPPLSSSSARNAAHAGEADEPSPPSASDGPGFQWTESLHARFMMGLFSYALKHASPKKIMKMMAGAYPSTLTMEHVKSHLQKLRVNSSTTRDPQIKLCEYYIRKEYNTQTRRVRKDAASEVIQPGTPMRMAIPIELLTDPKRFSCPDSHVLEAIAAGILEPLPLPSSNKRKAKPSSKSAAVSVNGQGAAKKPKSGVMSEKLLV